MLMQLVMVATATVFHGLIRLRIPVEVAIVDDFRTGRREFVAGLLADPGVTLHEGDVLDQELLEQAFVLDEARNRCAPAINLAIDAVEIADLFGVQIDPNRNPAAASRQDRIDEFILAINSPMVGVQRQRTIGHEHPQTEGKRLGWLGPAPRGSTETRRSPPGMNR